METSRVCWRFGINEAQKNRPHVADRSTVCALNNACILDIKGVHSSSLFVWQAGPLVP
jgi:hypothetical protein